MMSLQEVLGTEQALIGGVCIGNLVVDWKHRVLAYSKLPPYLAYAASDGYIRFLRLREGNDWQQCPSLRLHVGCASAKADVRFIALGGEQERNTEHREFLAYASNRLVFIKSWNRLWQRWEEVATMPLRMRSGDVFYGAIEWLQWTWDLSSVPHWSLLIQADGKMFRAHPRRWYEFFRPHWYAEKE